ncbi:MAG: T9SS type A sorting domain-containing protein [Saprospiraceae bacterium]|nr:T9SS type A sorting domain-containing protein [Saprospiraceae bacterium]
MRNNFWGITTGGVPITDPMPLDFLFLLDPACSTSVAAPILLPLASRNVFCPLDQRPESFATPFPGSECMLSVGSGGTTGNPIRVHEQFHLGTFLMKSDSVEAGIEAMRPVAALWQAEMSGFPDNCQQYIRVAKAFVDASDSNLPDLPRPGGERAKASTAGSLVIVPNPANNSALLQLQSAEYQVRVWDTQGKLCHQATASDTYRLETAAWQPGIYYVEAVGPDGSRRNGKLVVQR